MNLTTDHAQSSYGQPVLVDPETSQAFGPADMLPHGRLAAVWASENLPDDDLLKRYRD